MNSPSSPRSCLGRIPTGVMRIAAASAVTGSIMFATVVTGRPRRTIPKRRWSAVLACSMLMTPSSFDSASRKTLYGYHCAHESSGSTPRTRNSWRPSLIIALTRSLPPDSVVTLCMVPFAPTTFVEPVYCASRSRPPAATRES